MTVTRNSLLRRAITLIAATAAATSLLLVSGVQPSHAGRPCPGLVTTSSYCL